MPKIERASSFKITGRIAGGNRAAVGDFPWHTSLVIKYPDDSVRSAFCSGAILNEKWILTTADCVIGANGIRVDVGSVDINTPLLSVYPDAFVLHPQYDNSNNKFINNIAILRLSSKTMLNFTSVVAKNQYGPIRLPKKRQIDETFIGFESVFSGFGYPSIGWCSVFFLKSVKYHL